MSGPQILELTGFLALGAVAGTVYFLLLRQSVVRFVRHGATLQAVPLLLLLRVGAAALVFWGAAQAGAWPLLVAAGGFLAARTTILILAGRGP